MSLPEFNFQTVFLLLFAWTAVAVAFGMLICAAIHHADVAEGTEDGQDDDTWLDDAPTDVLSTDEVNRRIERLESQMRHPSGRSDKAAVADFERRRDRGWL